MKNWNDVKWQRSAVNLRRGSARLLSIKICVIASALGVSTSFGQIGRAEIDALTNSIKESAIKEQSVYLYKGTQAVCRLDLSKVNGYYVVKSGPLFA